MTEGNQIEVEGKFCTISKKIMHNYDLSSEDNSKLSGTKPNYRKTKNPRMITENQEIKKKMRMLLSPRK